MAIEISAPTAAKMLIINRIPRTDSSLCTSFAIKPKAASIQPLIAPPIVQPSFWDIDEDEKMRPVARRPVFNSE